MQILSTPKVSDPNGIWDKFILEMIYKNFHDLSEIDNLMKHDVIIKEYE